jgi:outer membrane protein OmpA-like peptidoglycan-associated protein
MKTPAAWKTCLFAVVLATGCGEREAAAPPAGADAGEVAPPESVDMGPLPATASTAPAAPAAATYAISSDPDRPAPLPALEFAGTGTGKSESRYYAFDAGAGTVVVTATANNSPSGATQALGFALYDRQANRLCFDSHGNTTSPKTVVLNCTIEKAQPLLLRLDLSPESLDHAIALSGPVALPAPVADAAEAEVAGAGSTDIDAPTHLATNRVAADGTGKPVSYYYAFNAGPGELTLTGDGSNTSAAMTEALRLGLYTLRSERICELSLGNTTLDKRAVTTCTLDTRQPVILRADLSAETVAFRARFEGPYDFDPYAAPAEITIALDASVLFDTGKDALKPEARTTLREAADRVKKFADAAVLISGHTDNVGGDAGNQALSERRAAAVRDHFVREQGIAAARLQTRGYGATQPVADNGTEAGRARNRRVDVVISPAK